MPQRIHVNGFETATPGQIDHRLRRVPGSRPAEDRRRARAGEVMAA